MSAKDFPAHYKLLRAGEMAGGDGPYVRLVASTISAGVTFLASTGVPLHIVQAAVQEYFECARRHVRHPSGDDS